MCWVMPPASPAATLDLRITSSKVVLPWSTCPMIVTTGARGFISSGLSSTSSSTFRTGVCAPAPRSRFSTSKRKPYLAQIRCATSSSIDWLTLAKTPTSIRSAMIWKGLRFSCSARSRTMMGGLSVINCPVAGGTNFSGWLGGRGRGRRRFLGRPLPQPLPGLLWRPARRSTWPTAKIAATVGKPVLPPAVAPRPVLLSGCCRDTGLGGSWTQPTFSPIFGTAGAGGGAGRAGAFGISTGGGGWEAAAGSGVSTVAATVSEAGKTALTGGGAGISTGSGVTAGAIASTAGGASVIRVMGAWDSTRVGAGGGAGIRRRRGHGRHRRRIQLDQLVFEEFSGDFVQGTGRHFGLGNAQVLGFGKDFLAFDAKLLC